MRLAATGDALITRRTSGFGEEAYKRLAAVLRSADVRVTNLETLLTNGLGVPAAAGCDAVIGHGPHRLRGVEVYKGKPISYSLGNFIFQNEEALVQPADFYERLGLDPLTSTPADAYDRRNKRGEGGLLADRAYWESAVAWWHIDGGRLSDLRLYPIDLGFGRPRPRRGRPSLGDALRGADHHRPGPPFAPTRHPRRVGAAGYGTVRW